MAKLTRTQQAVRGLILTSMAVLMVAGFALLGGLGSSDSAEGFYRCKTRWYDRCSTTQTVTEDQAFPGFQ